MIRLLQLIIPVCIVLVTTLGIYLLSANAPQAKPHPVTAQIPLIQTYKVVKQTVSIPVHSRGIVQPKAKLTLIAQVPGTIIDVANGFNNGGFFKKDDVLIQIDPAHYQLEMTKKQHAVDAAQLNLEEVKAKANVARKIAKTGATDFALHIPQVVNAQSQLAAAKADLALSEIRLQQTIIKAPFDGRFRTTEIDQNQYVIQGQIMAEVFALDKAEVRLPISDQQLGLLELPTPLTNNIKDNTTPPVTLSSDIGGRRYHWHANVIRSEGGLDQNRLQYVVAEIQTPYLADTYPLEMGRFVEAEIKGRTLQHIAVLPRQAIHSGNKVWVLNPEHRLSARAVDIVYRGKSETFVAQGLNEGELVVLTPLDFAIEGMQVAVSTTTHATTQQPK
ncbi:RND superfamily NFE family efflux transporter membrane fusion subunit [Oleiphilus messinensis]|uniref:RND superfamily NFE family efflux transporter membrane fusion subunit n=1 Tax=Oleiphilus messinensis TaxID=141451 RepID=A0A1Y0IB79_9GAMM|nr:efflux RND transporter periplasmic adaptor subunit [Oleiphilus messinensis]ARU57419.1 RND superfamily NFE family efflux transporter membrane fusion subunit [Oleiphilus messinensis]